MQWDVRDFDSDEVLTLCGSVYAMYEVKRVMVEQRNGILFATLLVTLVHRWK